MFAVLKTIAYLSGNYDRLQVLFGLKSTMVGFMISEARVQVLSKAVIRVSLFKMIRVHLRMRMLSRILH
jgi:hypothetical protein